MADQRETASGWEGFEIDEAVSCDDLRKCVTGRIVLCGGSKVTGVGNLVWSAAERVQRQ